MPKIPDSYYHRKGVALPKSTKVAYVKEQEQDRPHHCHWPGCEEHVPPAKWGCMKHWMRLPAHLRARIWNAYRPGQEKDMNPSLEYVVVARAVQDWIEYNYGSKK